MRNDMKQHGFNLVDNWIDYMSEEDATCVLATMDFPSFIPAETIERAANEMGKIIALPADDVSPKDMLSFIFGLAAGGIFEEDLASAEVQLLHEMWKEVEEDEPETIDIHDQLNPITELADKCLGLKIGGGQ